MPNGPDHDIIYPAEEDILGIHSDIIEDDDDAEGGVLNQGTVDFALNCIEHGHYGEVPETIHEKAYELMRLLAANHTFVDGNKRTALNATWTFYAMNGLYFAYGEEIKAILKLLAVKEAMVDDEQAINHFEGICYPEHDDRVPQDIVRFLHLPRWYKDVSERIERWVVEYEKSGELPDFTNQKEADLFIELATVLTELIELKDARYETLPEEVIEAIEELEEDWKEAENTLWNAAEEAGEVPAGSIVGRLIQKGLIDQDNNNL